MFRTTTGPGGHCCWCLFARIRHHFVRLCISPVLLWLQHNRTLTTLQISCNVLGNIGGMYFAECIQLNKGLIELDIGDTDLVSSFAHGDIGFVDQFSV